ncbi:MAG: hypothetical protein SV583_00285 [Pseudomonadota bacterium]|nr:hypothetical protein [Pseudomonadota bacterium]
MSDVNDRSDDLQGDADSRADSVAILSLILIALAFVVYWLSNQ